LALDEPTSALDVTIQSRFDLVSDLQQSTTWLFVDHRSRVVHAMSHRIITLKKATMIM
jgi:ABC-type microcin C transport system duplicated ATPase subunit YejF